VSEKASLEVRAKVAERIGTYTYDPLGFVMFAYPWGQEGSKLAHRTGPEDWQREFLATLGQHMRDNADTKSMGLDYFPWRSAIASGHGIGKSALVSWLVQFFMSTRRDVRGGVTANTGWQLQDKTWPELAKWHDMLINKDWFTWTSTTYYFSEYPEEKRKNWMFTAQTWNEDKPDSFAGLHNENGAVVWIFDEASGIPPVIHETAEGGMTDGEPFKFDFGNPINPSGEFYDSFNINSARMSYLRNIDSRTVSHTNKTVIGDLLYKCRFDGGEDSDVFKYRVRGLFPAQSLDGFLSAELINESMTREHEGSGGAGLILGVDVARFGDDQTIICPRRGRDARSIPWAKWGRADTVESARRVAEFARKYRAQAVVIESVGPGVGVIDVLRNMYGIKVIEVHPGVKAAKELAWNNKRTELYMKMKDWFQMSRGVVPHDMELYKQATNIRYFINGQTGKMSMEPKADYKTRMLGTSPDELDALMLTFETDVGFMSDTFSTARPREQAQAIVEENPIY
jgi:hypothetical protein